LWFTSVLTAGTLHLLHVAEFSAELNITADFLAIFRIKMMQPECLETFPSLLPLRTHISENPRKCLEQFT
jgi:hypothetical protein